MTAHQARWGGGPAQPDLPCGGPARADLPAGAPEDGGVAVPEPVLAELDREWDPFTRLLLLLEVSGRRSWLEDIVSHDRL